MITVSIAEEKNRIYNVMTRMLSHKKTGFSKGFDEGEYEYLFLPMKEEEKRDVVLLHKPVDLSCTGDYVTVLNADEQFSAWPRQSLLITYGLNPLSTITASSIRNDEEGISFFCCLQRSIATLKGNILEPQEFLVNLPVRKMDISEALGAVTLGLVFSVSPKEFDSLFFEKNLS
ncbi:MAG: hypothetical protein E7403_08095 [Ruminococcaceae bacterium]|nr:hypothetical protein [Oscillospiraceae bacterium]